jgi:gamma-glutamylcysteine synthetase
MSHCLHVHVAQVEAGWSTLVMMEAAGSDSGTPTSPVTLVEARLMALDEDAEAAVEQMAAAQRELTLDEGEADAAAAAAAAAGAGTDREQLLAEQFMAEINAQAAGPAMAAAKPAPVAEQQLSEEIMAQIDAQMAAATDEELEQIAGQLAEQQGGAQKA